MIKILKGTDQISVLGKNIEKKSFKGIFLVGSNNKGKTKVLNNFYEDNSSISKLIKILDLIDSFEKSFHDSIDTFTQTKLAININWFNYTIEKIEKINAILDEDILFTEPEDGFENLSDAFSIDGTPLTSSGYQTLFLLISKILFLEDSSVNLKWILLDECDAHLDLINKKKYMNLVANIIKDKKVISSTHSPYTIEEAKGFLISNIETNDIYYSNDITSFGVAEKIIAGSLNHEFILSVNLEWMSKLYKYSIIEDRMLTIDESDKLNSIDYNELSYKEKILYNQLCRKRTRRPRRSKG